MKKLLFAVLLLVYLAGNTWADEYAAMRFFIISGEMVKVMKQIPAASGEKYEAADAPETILWNKENWVSLTVAGRDYPNYDVWQPLGRGRIWLP